MVITYENNFKKIQNYYHNFNKMEYNYMLKKEKNNIKYNSLLWKKNA